MSTATQKDREETRSDAAVKTEGERMIEYVPLGETEPIKLSIGMIRKYIAKPTRSGALPSDQDLMQFLMLNKARGLNPWVGDSYLVGYDSKNGPTFSLITAAQALLKRAELNPNYRALTYGIIALKKEGSVVEYLEGDFLPPGYVLLGGWAKCFRDDRAAPIYDALNLTVYDQQNRQWQKDPAGMIVKCAMSSVLRTAFPSQCGGMYTQEEIDRRMTVDGTVVAQQSSKGISASPVQAALSAPRTAPASFAVTQTAESVYTEQPHERTRIIPAEELKEVAEVEQPVVASPELPVEAHETAEEPNSERPSVQNILDMLKKCSSAKSVAELQGEVEQWNWMDAEQERIDSALDAKKASFGKK